MTDCEKIFFKNEKFCEGTIEMREIILFRKQLNNKKKRTSDRARISVHNLN